MRFVVPCLLAAVLGLLPSRPARGQDLQQDLQLASLPERGARRWAVGLQVGPLDLPRGHVGLPLEGTIDGYHLPVGIITRWRWNDRMAMNLGVGLPHSGLGLSVWLGHELFVALVQDRRGVARIELYENAGLTFGFAGPDYYARHSNVFVGYAYAAGGPLALGLRLPIGLRVRWFRGAFDTFVEPASLVMLTPSLESLFELAVGFRIRL